MKYIFEFVDQELNRLRVVASSTEEAFSKMGLNIGHTTAWYHNIFSKYVLETVYDITNRPEPRKGDTIHLFPFMGCYQVLSSFVPATIKITAKTWLYRSKEEHDRFIPYTDYKCLKGKGNTLIKTWHKPIPTLHITNEGVANFGKYRGERFEDIFINDPNYITWLKGLRGVTIDKHFVDRACINEIAFVSQYRDPTDLYNPEQ